MPLASDQFATVEETMTTPSGATISFEKGGLGPPLVLVHGSFSDHRSNWALVRPLFERCFTVFALARRGRGKTDGTTGHGVEDEARDVLALIDRIGSPVFLLGHSYGAQVALAAAALDQRRIDKLILYEPPRPDGLRPAAMAELESAARQNDWDGLATVFFQEVLELPSEALQALRGSEDWAPIVGDARASMGDLRALARHQWTASRFSALTLPVLLQFGSESARSMFVTDDLADILPDGRPHELVGQGHEAMQTAPDAYAQSVFAFLKQVSRSSIH